MPPAAGCSTSRRPTSSRCRRACCPRPLSDELLRVDDVIRREQYLDFIKGRMFRQTLLCRAELDIDRSPQPLIVERLAVSSPTQRDRRSRSEGPGHLRRAHGLHADDGSPTRQSGPGACGQQLARCALWVRDLIPEDASEADRLAICDAVLRCYAANLVQLHADATAVDHDGQRTTRGQPARPPPSAFGAARHEPAPRERATRRRPRTGVWSCCSTARAITLSSWMS